MKSNKSVAFLYSKDKQAENDNQGNDTPHNATNNIKYLGMSLNEQMKDPYKNFTSLKNLKISQDGKMSHAHGLA